MFLFPDFSFLGIIIRLHFVVNEGVAVTPHPQQHTNTRPLLSSSQSGCISIWCAARVYFLRCCNYLLFTAASNSILGFYFPFGITVCFLGVMACFWFAEYLFIASLSPVSLTELWMFSQLYLNITSNLLKEVFPHENTPPGAFRRTALSGLIAPWISMQLQPFTFLLGIPSITFFTSQIPSFLDLWLSPSMFYSLLSQCTSSVAL